MINYLKNLFSNSVNKPSFLVIGVQKGGTTALHEMLNTHSMIRGAKCKEIHYFDRDNFILDDSYNEYHNFFNDLEKKKIYFETTPSYICHELSPERIFKYNPALKLIITLREPASRAYSAWVMYHHNFANHSGYKEKYDERSFEKVIEDGLNSDQNISFILDRKAYVKRGIYHLQIKNYLKYFSSENIFILENKELLQDQNNTLNRIFDFLNVPNESIPIMKQNEGKVSGIDKNDDTYIKLREFYRPHNEKLFELLGKRFDW